MIHGNILSTTVLVFFPGKRGGSQQNFIREGPAARFSTLLIYRLPFLTDKRPLSYTFY